MGLNTQTNATPAQYPVIIHAVNSPAAELADLPDNSLVELFVNERSAKAFEELVNRYSDKVMRLALRITRNETEAEEALQNVFLALLKKLNSFRGDSKFSTWVYRVALNTAYMHTGIAKKKVERETSLENYAPYNERGELHGVSEKSWGWIPDEELLSREGAEIINNTVDELPLKYRVMFQLGDVEGLSDKQTAEVLGLSLSAVKSRKRRARLFLRDKLSNYYYDRPVQHL